MKETRLNKAPIFPGSFFRCSKSLIWNLSTARLFLLTILLFSRAVGSTSICPSASVWELLIGKLYSCPIPSLAVRYERWWILIQMVIAVYKQEVSPCPQFERGHDTLQLVWGSSYWQMWTVYEVVRGDKPNNLHLFFQFCLISISFHPPTSAKPFEALLLLACT